MLAHAAGDTALKATQSLLASSRQQSFPDDYLLLAEQETDLLWLWGVLLCVAGSTFTALGLVLQKYSHMNNQAQSLKVGSVYFRQTWWIVGFAVFLVAQVVNFVSMGMAPQVMLSALGVWSLVSNTVFAWIILGERLQPQEFSAMSGIIVGVLLVISGTPASRSPTLVFKRDVVDVSHDFFAFKFLMLVVCLVGFVGSIGAVSFKFYRQSVPLFWALVSAVATGFTTMLFRCVSLLLVSPSLGQESPWHHVQLYVLLATAGLIAVGQVHSLNMALQVGDAMTVVPAYYALGMLAQILTAAVFFKELDDFEGWLQAAMFWGGVALLIACVVWMTRVHISAETELPPSPKAGDSPKDLLKPPEESPKGRQRTMTYLDMDALPESFPEGRQRIYSVSVTGPMGIA